MDGTAVLRHLPLTTQELLRRIAAVASAGGAESYLVGGAVRDLLLGRATNDLDVVVAGDALTVARQLAPELGADLRVYEPFLTATVAWAGGQIDVIAARRERYPVPGALPEVAPGTLADDLRRRDFTVNAIAAALDEAAFGALVDPLGGQGDLRAGQIRALHDRSFADDPTRLLRAVRYEQRLAALADAPVGQPPRAGAVLAPARPFAIESETLGWLRAAVAGRALATVSVDRIRDEFARLLAEPAAAAMVARLDELGLLAQIEPALRWDELARRAFAELDRGWLEETALPRWMGRFAILAAHLTPVEAGRLSSALRVPTPLAKLLDEVARLPAEIPAFATPLPNSSLAARLDCYSDAALLVLAASAANRHVRTQITRYRQELRGLRPQLDGNFLRALGVHPGPIYREALTALLARKRDEPALDAAGEAAFLRDWLRVRGALPE